MTYDDDAPASVCARVATGFIGVLGAAAVIGGTYAIVLERSRLAPLVFLFCGCFAAIVMCATAVRLRRYRPYPDAVARAIQLATMSAIAALVSFVVLLVPITAAPIAAVVIALVQAVLAGTAIRLWWRNAPVSITAGESE
ncbi:hypothetical protein H8R18_00385 [Nanchangia anserum]|uniref:Uncharacterized protein n=1 Tax=Nanchangia anserum TaxID=2692125 RepID=A0A8I0GGQ5_9ACTO|nr:hypothetical protein [Nanchangia anserum]MBD3689704.1 hypothetical protein [Nanchangia anserum]QOX81879.1 hypothetical protein H8R18_00385 [Nanchangia anserum]